MNESRGYALITGASAGIGAAFARELACRKVDLVLSARRLDRLQSLADELVAKHAIKVEVMACDLADRDAPRHLVARLDERNIAIDMLINNAGYGVTGYFLSQPWQTQADFIQVLMTAPTELCHRLLPAMRARGHGRIINVASLAGHVPGSAGQTLYAGAKSYLIKLSQALQLEYRDDGVNTCALCPGFTYSEFHDVTGSRAMMSKLPRWMWMDAETVVRQGLDAVERGDALYVNGRVNRTIKAVFKLIPDRLALRMIGRQSRKFRKQSPD
ncbi:MAG: SDR family oxidoreductase [Xanthomonadales bacterium]|uniref:SDR family NAD(P)-dependent oxidoreductase n=1 Tax=Dokdonella sp. TaxID=2291710 RepID=UPI002BDB4E00|nr:SDR family oxidoreductase [Xanthomonadales bacterium]HQV71511.1 SDR family oxidoreductase [Dokdonella sp.]MBK7013333.1 SDR family oxidoreductase [Xanthomonadales bacterium]MBK7211500.1 SDR family oxidoreductase [Xanthomonadales bacterium]MBL0221333.1 SDR family oxidoreductase [Xanthomonadales bacterium]